MSNPAESAPPDPTLNAGRKLVRPTAYRWFQWRVEALVVGGFENVLGSVPLPWVVRLGRLLGAIACVFARKRRHTVARNLRIAFAAEKTPAEINALTNEVFRRSGANLFGSLRTARLSDKALERVVVLRDEHIYREAVSQGRGVVMVLAHMGNWEALAQWFPRLLPPGVQGATIYRPLNNPIMNARVAAMRKRRGVVLFSKDDNPLGMASFIRRGGVLGVLADQRAGKVGELVPFFGRLTSCSPIPAILARRTNAITVGISLRTISTGRWEMRFHALNEETPSTAGIMGLVERMMRESPTDVFWLQDRWKVQAGEPHIQQGKPARVGGWVVTKRRRALLWAGVDDVLPRAPIAVPDDVDYEIGLRVDASPAWLRTLEVNGPKAVTIHRYQNNGAAAFLEQVNAAAEQPLDFVVGAENETKMRKACREFGVVWMNAQVLSGVPVSVVTNA